MAEWRNSLVVTNQVWKTTEGIVAARATSPWNAILAEAKTMISSGTDPFHFYDQQTPMILDRPIHKMQVEVYEFHSVFCGGLVVTSTSLMPEMENVHISSNWNLPAMGKEKLVPIPSETRPLGVVNFLNYGKLKEQMWNDEVVRSKRSLH